MGDPSSRYWKVRGLTDALCAPLSVEDMCLQSMPDVSPLKWHLAHTSWFFETLVLRRHLPGYVAFDAGYEYLFNSYYNTIGAQYPRPQRGLVSRPGVAEVRAYRAHVDGAMGRLLELGVAEEGAAIIELGLHHEQQHQELMVTDLKHALSHNPLGPVVCERADGESTGEALSPPRFVAFPGGMAELGAAAGDGFCYDNEAPRHQVWMHPFAIADRPVSVAEYVAFVDDGGYGRAELWLSDGWAWLQQQGISAPLYFGAARGGGGGRASYTLSGCRRLSPSEPMCHLSHYEADAYARWAGARLPTEHEWEVAARSCGDVPPDADLLDPARLHPRPLGDGQGLRGMFGGVWEWTASAYLPYPGFRPFAGEAAEYNGKFMSGQMVLRGGSCATPTGHLRATYRNFFPPAARWQFSGLRLARDA